VRVLLDTNVLIAAFISRGACSDLLEHCARAHHVVASEEILHEFRRTLHDKFHTPLREAREAVALLRSRLEIVRPIALSDAACRDPDDDMVLATALAGRCAAIVTGDADLLVLSEWQNIPIIRPRDFWRFEAEGHPA